MLVDPIGIQSSSVSPFLLFNSAANVMASVLADGGIKVEQQRANGGIGS
jgi:hypothetical protein